jgi:nucleotide-binding universal stress UspA family protein
VLHVVHEAVAAAPFGPMFEAYVEDSEAIRRAMLTDAQERLARRITSDDRARFRATTEVMFGPVSETIANYADVNGFDLVVMGTHGRSGFAHLMMGSVAERVVRTAHCPVMTTHTHPERARELVLGRREVASA